MFRNSRHLEKPPSAMVIAAPLVPAKALFRCQPSMPLASAMIAASPANQPSTRKQTQQTAWCCGCCGARASMPLASAVIAVSPLKWNSRRIQFNKSLQQIVCQIASMRGSTPQLPALQE